MPDPSQLLAMLNASRGAPPSAAPSGAVPPPAGAAPPMAAMSGMSNPMAALAQRGASPGVPDEAMQMLMFLAGMGFPEFARTIDKIRGPQTKDHHGKQTGMKGDAATSGGMAPSPQMLQMLQQRMAMAKALPQLGAGGQAAMPLGMPMPGAA